METVILVVHMGCTVNSYKSLCISCVFPLGFFKFVTVDSSAPLRMTGQKQTATTLSPYFTIKNVCHRHNLKDAIIQ